MVCSVCSSSMKGSSGVKPFTFENGMSLYPLDDASEHYEVYEKEGGGWTRVPAAGDGKAVGLIPRTDTTPERLVVGAKYYTESVDFRAVNDDAERVELLQILRDLTPMEVSLLRPVAPLVSYHRTPTGMFSYSGHVIALERDLRTVASALLRRAADTPMQLVVPIPPHMKFRCKGTPVDPAVESGEGGEVGHAPLGEPRYTIHHARPLAPAPRLGLGYFDSTLGHSRSRRPKKPGLGLGSPHNSQPPAPSPPPAPLPFRFLFSSIPPVSFPFLFPFYLP